MKICVCENYDEMSRVAADVITDVVKSKPDCVLGLATGDTPKGIYKLLIERYNAGELDFSRVHSVNLDEYHPITPDNENSYKYFMNTVFFDHINIDPANTAVPDGTTKDPVAFCEAYDKNIEELGGIDVQLLGIGRNGHIGFNEPDEALTVTTHVTDLTESTIEANARFFESADEVPKKAITMGIASILKSRKIVMLVSGKEKHEALSALLDDAITCSNPATMLKAHPDVVIICDRAAYEGNGELKCILVHANLAGQERPDEYVFRSGSPGAFL